jgi:ABC-type spermidine/putrescine transport system permease subunit II
MSIDDFIITHFVSGSYNNFSTWLYGNLKTMKNGQWNQACAYNSVLMIVTFSAIIIYQIVSMKKNANKKKEAM